MADIPDNTKLEILNIKKRCSVILIKSDRKLCQNDDPCMAKKSNLIIMNICTRQTRLHDSSASASLSDMHSKGHRTKRIRTQRKRYVDRARDAFIFEPCKLPPITPKGI